MVDTLRLGAMVRIVGGMPALERRGWVVTEVRKLDAPPSLSAQVRTAEGVRVQAWEFEGGTWVTLEASLPKLARGENATLLTDWQAVADGAGVMVASAAAAAGQPFPPLGVWTVRRIDAVWAWEYPAAPYLDALVLASIPRCVPAAYPTGRRWALPGGGVFGRAYDKAAEAGGPVALPLRVERQARPKKNVVRVDGRQLEPPWAAWSGSAALGMVRAMVNQVGLDKPIATPLAARARLVQVHGSRRGRNVFGAMLDAREGGGWHALDVDPQTRRRYQRAAAAAGVTTLGDVELPPLVVPG